MFRFKSAHSKNRAAGIFSVCFLIWISTAFKQPGSAFLFISIAVLMLRGKIDFDVRIGNQYFFRSMGMMSVTAVMTIGLLGEIYWGLTEIILNMLAMMIFLSSYIRGQE